MPSGNASAVVLCGYLLLSACAHSADIQANALTHPSNDRIVVVATDQGFQPNHLAVPANSLTTLVFIRRTSKACLHELVLYAQNGDKTKYELPVGEEVPVPVRFKKRGQAGFTCGTGMYMGQIEVK